MIIYKYLDQKGTLKTIKKNSVLLRSPEQFNDPFDCVFWSSEEERKEAFGLFMNFQCFKDLYSALIKNGKNIVKNKPLAVVEKHNLKLIAQQITKNKKYEFSKEIGIYYTLYKVVFKKSDAAIEKAFNKTIDDIYKKIRRMALVSCFSLNSESLLMWSHYAKNHTGACIEFEIDDDNFKKMEYSKEICSFQLSKALEYIFAETFLNEKFNYKNELFSFALNPLLTKSEDWIYEQEVRCIFSDSNRDKRIYPYYNKLLLKMPPIKRVIVGCKANKDFIDKIRRLDASIPIIRLKEADGKYKLEEIDQD